MNHEPTPTQSTLQSRRDAIRSEIGEIDYLEYEAREDAAGDDETQGETLEAR